MEILELKTAMIEIYNSMSIRRKYLKKNDTENMIYGGTV